MRWVPLAPPDASSPEAGLPTGGPASGHVGGGHGRTTARAEVLTAAPRRGPWTLLGVIGFFVTGFDDFAAHTGESLLGFMINPLHNIVHLVIGVAGLLMGRT